MKIGMTRLSAIGAGMLYLAVAGPAGAVAIDFRNHRFAPAPDLNHHTVDNRGYSFSFDTLHIAGMHPNGSLSWNEADGFGIIGAGWENDEIEFPEVLSLSFGETLYVEQLFVTNLFIEHDGIRPERGFYSFDGGSSWNPFSADGLDDNGELSVEIGVMTSQLLLTSAGSDIRTRRNGHEFALAGIELYHHQPGGKDRDHGQCQDPAVPEPTAALLFASGALVIGRRNRRA